MSDLATTLVAWLVIFTYPVAALTVLVGALGVPLPTAVIVLAAGSLSTTDSTDVTDGTESPNLLLLFGIILAAAVIGDLASYSLGRWGGNIVLGRWGARVGLTPARLQTVERRFERWGGLLVLVTRFLLTGLATPTNLVAGASTYPIVRFLAYVAVGNAIWTGQFLALGWLFGPSWVSLLDYLDDTMMVLTTVAIATVLLIVLVRLLRQKPA